MVKKLMSEHRCQDVRTNRLATSKWIAKVLATDFRDDPNMSLGNIRQKLQDRYGLTGLPKCKLFRARLKAKSGKSLHTERIS